MKKSSFAPMLLFLLLFAGSVLAQDWVESDEGASTYNCTLIGKASADFGAYDIARVDEDNYSLIDFFAIIVSACVPVVETTPASPDHEPDWTASAMHQTEYDCAVLRLMLAAYGGEILVQAASDVSYTLSEFFASLVPDCIPGVDITELVSRIGSTDGWVAGTNESYEFNCAFVSAAIAEYGQLDLYRFGEKILTVGDYLNQSVPRCSARTDLPAQAPPDQPHDNEWVRFVEGQEAACATIKQLVYHYGADDFLRSGNYLASVFDYYQDIVPDCIFLAVLARAGTELVECLEDECDNIGQLARDTTLSVTGFLELGYQVAYGDSSAFVALSADVLPPDETVIPNDGTNIDAFDCFFSPLAWTSRPTKAEIIDLSTSELETSITMYSPLQPLGIYMIEFARKEAVYRIAVPATYEAAYEFLIQCE